MKPLSCAISAQRAGEDLIGTAGYYQTYVLIECPLPWPKNAFDSPCIPLALRQYVDAIRAKQSIQFLCINRGTASQPSRTAVLVYERTDQLTLNLSDEDFANSYRGHEFQVNGLDQVITCLENHWQGQQLGRTIDQQDIFICTHGMRDKCCAQFGQPFFRVAKRSVQQGDLPNIRVWKVSHIGGHRFAPTAISLPDGRYYGRLTLSVLQAIVTRSGPVSQLCSVYRGWGMLPPPLQVLERQLLLNHGWQWLNCKIAYLTSEVSDAPNANYGANHGGDRGGNQIQVELFVRAPNAHKVTLYHAKIIRDAAQTFCTKASCGDRLPSTFIKYAVAACSMTTYSLLEYSLANHLRPETVSVL